jgi:DNA-directed RNA polymerase subunit RPC12/RpoP
MAVKNICPKCKKSFSAPDDSLGKKVECPGCGHRSILRTAEELKELEEVQTARQRKIEEDRERLALIEKMEARNRGGRPYYEEYGVGTESVLHYNPNAPSRFLRVRALSEVLILGAYLVLFLEDHQLDLQYPGAAPLPARVRGGGGGPVPDLEVPGRAGVPARGPGRSAERPGAAPARYSRQHRAAGVRLEA